MKWGVMLNKDERKIFNLVKKFLGENYQKSDDEVILLYAETKLFYSRIKKDVEESYLLYDHVNKSGETNPTKNPLIVELTKTVQTLNNLLKSLGLTPAQRKSLESAESCVNDI